MRVELETEGFKKGDVIGHDLLVREIKLVFDYGVYMVIRQKVVCNYTTIHYIDLPGT